jgi:hypothetical protein
VTILEPHDNVRWRAAGPSSHEQSPIEEILALLEPPAWHAHAACAGMGADRFFPERGIEVADALNVCGTCPVTAECLDAGLMERSGVWGGLPERRRRNLRRTVNPPRTLTPCGTTGAYHRHRSRGETPCEPCRQAHSDYIKTRRAR